MATTTTPLPSLEEMADAGMHYGHQTRRWHPKMRPYIYDTREGIHIINLEKTLDQLKNSTEVLANRIESAGTILIVGTKRQAAHLVKKLAIEAGFFYIIDRWPGGLLTNFESIHKIIDKYQSISSKTDNLEPKEITTKEKYQMIKEKKRLEKIVGGLVGMTKTPDLIIIVDPRREKTAINEARKTKTPTIGIIDTNTDPTLVDYPIPANDDALKSIELILNTLMQTAIRTKPLPS